MEQPHPFLPAAGEVFHEHYRVVRCLGAGGMGAVYEVVDARTDRRRALKVLLPALAGDGEMRQRFAQEARVTANLPGEHLIEVMDAGVDEATGSPFLVMELLVGETIEERLRRGPLSLDEATGWLEQVAAGLEVAHAVGVVHRDLTPSNVFLTRRPGRAPGLKVLDFGVAKVVATTLAPRTTAVVGTPAYMAPEQVRGDGDIDPRADVYALGQLAFTMLVGHPFLERALIGNLPTTLESRLGPRREPASRRAGAHGIALPPGFDDWFAVATALEPHRRFDSIHEAASQLRAIARGEGFVAPASRASEWRREALAEEPLARELPPRTPDPPSTRRSGVDRRSLLAAGAGAVLASGISALVLPARRARDLDDDALPRAAGAVSTGSATRAVVVTPLADLRPDEARAVRESERPEASAGARSRPTPPDRQAARGEARRSRSEGVGAATGRAAEPVAPVASERRESSAERARPESASRHDPTDDR